MSYSIDLLTKQVLFSDYIGTVLYVILIMLTLSMVLNLTNNRLQYVKKRLDAKIRLDVDDVCLHADYAEIQSKNFIDKKNFALAAINNGSLELAIQCLKNLLSSVITMVGVLWIISATSFVILVPLAVSLLISIYYDYLKISTDFEYAKEIRMFHLRDSFQGRMDEVEQLLYRSREVRRRARRSSGILIYSSETVLDIAIYLYFGYKVIVAAAITLGQWVVRISGFEAGTVCFQR